MTKLTNDMRVMAHECGDVGEEYGAGIDIGAASAVFGDRLSEFRIGPSLGADTSLGAYDRWALIEGDRIVGELRDDACGLTIHVDRINGALVSVEGSI